MKVRKCIQGNNNENKNNTFYVRAPFKTLKVASHHRNTQTV